MNSSWSLFGPSAPLPSQNPNSPTRDVFDGPEFPGSEDPGQLDGGEIRALMEIERAWDVMEQHRSTLLGYLAGTPNYAEEDMLVF
ncbi:hypothetical protein E4U49_007175 [Claviceps purpurea]|nr:hypothetical protein E4U49_007175 [Claviceps purpurea]